MQNHHFIEQKTADGSSTLYSDSLKESYHSLNGAVQESTHIFLQQGLHCVRKKEMRILEIGFGTGLNALLTWQEAHRLGLHLHYESLEAYPVPPALLEKLDYSDYAPLLPLSSFTQLHACPWEETVCLEGERFYLRKRCTDFTETLLPDAIDVVYFDAFAPDKQPEMWEEEGFHRLFHSMNSGGILVTYCAKGEVRRRLQRAGFNVERLPGPPGKREMLRGIRP